jgi:DNA-binding transcriptional regulator PaaX
MRKYKNATHYVIAGLVPFTEPNLKLAFKPSAFFSDLSRTGTFKKDAIRNAFYRSIKSGLIVMDENNIPRLTNKGRLKIRPYTAGELKGSKLMVIFDIAEEERWKRQHLRLLLKELSFVQVQKSVWVTKYDHRDYLRNEVKNLDLQSSVILYECRKI